MTSLCTGLALLPLAITGDIPGHEIEHPMAVVILGGLVSSTLLSLFVVPVLYLGLARRRPASARRPPRPWPRARPEAARRQIPKRGWPAPGGASHRVETEETSNVRPALASLAVLAVVTLIGGTLPVSTALAAESKTYNPSINPADFEPRIAHKYFTLEPGTKFTYKRETSRGTERVETIVLHETKQVMGVTATVVREIEWLNETLIEDTRNWYAQDRSGNVWYFGEAVDNYRERQGRGP